VALMKTNIESMQAIHYIAKRTKKQMRLFGICGNKDKRGITT
jgi:tRNA(Glu) U13 pseudouridine synthase TruD